MAQSLKFDSEWSSFMSVCRCGARFEGSGKDYEKARAAEKAHVCPPRSETPRTYWLSFCDGNKPKGEQFLGVCIVDVTPDEAETALLDVCLRFPMAQEGAEWIAAAVTKAHQLGCNPGGEVASCDITEMVPSAPLIKNELLSYQRLEELGLQPVRA